MKITTSDVSYSLQKAYPSAWIVKNNRTDKSKNDRGRTKIYTGNKVYLTDNSEFEIELFNPTKKSVLAKIKINGSKISESGLVLRPGERVYLDCFLESKRKFVFKTYEVENTKESKKAIEDNGIVEVSFFDEKEEMTITEPEMYIPTNFDFQGYFYPTTGTKIYNSNTFTYQPMSTTTATSININTIDTGRVEKGDISNQNFYQVDMVFDKLLNKITYKILPEKTKAIKSEDLKPKNKNKKKEKN
jgi:hypothetical protein